MRGRHPGIFKSDHLPPAARTLALRHELTGSTHLGGVHALERKTNRGRQRVLGVKSEKTALWCSYETVDEPLPLHNDNLWLHWRRAYALYTVHHGCDDIPICSSASVSQDATPRLLPG